MKRKNQGSADTKRSLAGIFTSKDVVCGRGRGLERHPGNVAFRRFIRQFSDDYAFADRAEKSIMLAYLLQQMKQSNVRIFKKYDNGHYEEVDDHVLKHKIGHALRDSRNFPKGKPIKTKAKNVPKTTSTPFANAKFSEALAPLTFDRILDDIQLSIMVTSTRKTEETENDSTSLQVGSEQFISAIAVVDGPQPRSVALHNAIDQVGTYLHSQIESLAIRKGVSKGSDGRSHERHTTVSSENKRLCPTHDFDDPSEPVPLSMRKRPSGSLAFALAMGSTLTLKNTHRICDGELKASTAVEDATNCDGELDWGIEGLTCSGIETIYRDFNADINAEAIKADRKI